MIQLFKTESIQLNLAQSFAEGRVATSPQRPRGSRGGSAWLLGVASALRTGGAGIPTWDHQPCVHGGAIKPAPAPRVIQRLCGAPKVEIGWSAMPALHAALAVAGQ